MTERAAARLERQANKDAAKKRRAMRKQRKQQLALETE
jgi:hypothetical protein